MDRAYALLEIKSLNDDERVITGIASTPETDRDGDIMEPKGALFTLPIPLLWQHNSEQPIGQIFEAKVTSAGIEIKARIAKVSEPGTLKDRLDEAWQSMKAGLVKGLSVGFKPVESARIEGTFGLRFMKWLWLELSAVTIPANTSASILALKSSDHPFLAASGRHAETKHAGTPGVTGTVVRLARKDATTAMKTIQDQITGFEDTRKAKDADRNALMSAASEKGETLDQEQGQKYDDLTAEIDQIDVHLKRLRAAEASNVAVAKRVVASTTEEGSASRATETHQVRIKENIPEGMEFTRFVICKAVAFMSQGQISAAEVAKQRYPDNQRIHLALKAAVGGGTTLDASYATQLAYAQDLASAFLEYLRPQTIIGKIPGLTQVPFNVRYGTQTTGGSASWVGQGKPKPLTSFTFGNGTLGITKLASIAVLADELVRVSSPSAEELVRRTLAQCVQQQMDLDFIDPANAGTSNVKPASITNGVTALVSSGTTSDAVIIDIGKILKPILEAKLNPADVVFVMPATMALALGLMTNSLGQLVFPSVGATGGNLRGFTVVATQQAAFTSNYGNVVIALHAPSILLADDGQVAVDVSREASLEMLDGSLTQDGSAGTGASLVSMWQTNMLAIRAERVINWKKARTGSVQIMTDVNWGAIGSPA